MGNTQYDPDPDFEDESIEIVDLDDPENKHKADARLTRLKMVLGQQVQRHGRLFFVTLILLLVLFSGWRLIAQLLPVVPDSEQAQPSPLVISTVPPDIKNTSIPYVASDSMTYVIKTDGRLYALQALSGQAQWSRSLPVSGNSFLVSTDQAVYHIVSADGNTGIEAYRSTDGKLLWQEMEFSQNISFQPLIQDNVIYMEGDNGTVYAIQGTDGRLLWHFEPYIATDADSLIPMTALVHLSPGIVSIIDSHNVVHILHAYSGLEMVDLQDNSANYANWRMFVDHGILYFSGAGLRANADTQSIYAYRIIDGTKLWQKTFSTDSPMWWTESGGRVFVDDGTLRALRASDGMQQWEKAHTPVLWLTANASILYIETQDNSVHALNDENAHEIWHHEISANLALLPVLSNNILYFAPRLNMIEAWSASNGHLLWQYQQNSPLLLMPNIVGDVMYIQTLDNMLVLVRVNNGLAIWSYAM